MKRNGKIVVRKRLNYKGRKGKDSLVHTMSTLSRAMHLKFKSLTSSRRRVQFTSANLKLIVFRKLSYAQRLFSLKLCEHYKISLITEEHENGIMNFWHETSRKNLELKVLNACQKVKPNVWKTSHSIALKAYKLIPIHLYPWKIYLQSRFIADSFKKMEEYKIPLDPYLPATVEQRRILSGLPILRQANALVPGQELRQVVDSKSWRQTKIEEYFKPRRSF